jgi:hypothetical protein
VCHATTHDPVLGDDDQTDSPSRQEKGLYINCNCQARRRAGAQQQRGGVERRIAATLDQIRRDLSQMQRVQQTLFAFVDTLAKALLTDLPEQSSASVARGKSVMNAS